ncbi:AEC family transporter [Roseibacillus persicicus]|uniref:Malate permease n=1 Tax=Roseibacillus persicicus TaxID=454148 RepID=A0A918TKH2_9BACT|nr:AEC family transporter [Roseibacillus persicicus]MDQ8191659.1 AEC family transporter [Roseibacillus persicicus]GHC51781.1 malate permease [Roseibacillus persicicus]
MISFATVLEAVIPVYLLVGAGVALRRTKVLTPEVDGALLRLVIHFLYPCLILDKVLGNDLVLIPSVVASGIGAGFGIVMLGYAVSWLASRLLGMKKGTGSRSFTVAGGVQNFGYVAIPVLLALFVTSKSDDKVLGILFVHSLGVEIAIWIVGVMILTGRLIQSPKALLNGPIVAVVLGLVGSYSGAWRLLDPEHGPLIGMTIRQGMSWLGACAFPMALLLIGATVDDLLGKEKIDWKVATGGVLVRNVVMAFFILCLAKWLPVIPELKQVLVVQAAMPAAVTPIILTRIYGGQPQVAVQVVIATSILSLLTIPFVVAWGVAWAL